MKAVGIVAEYNPFHGGHQYQIRKIREMCGADTPIVAVMSGDFVQRGEAASYDKFTRAAAAVRGGVSLMIEQPLPWSLSSAEGFARGGVGLLGATGVIDALSFGRRKAPGKRQLDHERHAAAHRRFRAGEFIVRGRLAALHKIAGHDRDDGRIRPADFANFPYLVLVSAVKRVIFRNDADRFHKNPSFFLLRFGEKNAKINICETMIP